MQFTPDLLPGDITGTDVFRPQLGTFEFQAGPIFHNLILADEINRAPAKVQSALLEAMAERQVSVGGTTYPLPALFLVMATQNPIEQEGTYPLPEAQLDRFLMHVKVDYPNSAAERDILKLARREASTGEQTDQPEASSNDLALISSRSELLFSLIFELIASLRFFSSSFHISAHSCKSCMQRIVSIRVDGFSISNPTKPIGLA